MEFNYDILKTFIPSLGAHRDDFFAFENVFLSMNKKDIVILYRDPFSHKITVSVEDYNNKIKAVERNNTIDILLFSDATILD